MAGGLSVFPPEGRNLMNSGAAARALRLACCPSFAFLFRDPRRQKNALASVAVKRSGLSGELCIAEAGGLSNRQGENSIEGVGRIGPNLSAQTTGMPV
jgi:hypothetical protein